MDADIVVRAGRIAAVVPRSGAAGAGPPGAALPVLDATGLVVAPGFIDLQCNGAGGIDLAVTPERLWELAALLPRWGVTAWLPTILTAPERVYRRALASLQAGPPPARPGEPDVLARPVATPLGVHFEGPFLAPDRRGAHPAEHLRRPDPAAVDGWSRDTGVALVTLAPELPGALGLVRTLAERGVVVSLGHSGATVEQARAAVDAGARSVTHLFNAMGPLHHRAPGLAGVALTDDRVAVGLIADGVHVHPLAVKLAARTLGSRLVLVTDAVADLAVPPDTGPGPDDEEDEEEEGPLAVRMADGTIAGSLCPLHRAVANLWEMSGGSLEGAVAAATVAPARLLGLDSERGVIAPGAVADLVLLDTRPAGRIEVAATVIGGRLAHRNPARKVSGGP